MLLQSTVSKFLSECSKNDKLQFTCFVESERATVDYVIYSVLLGDVAEQHVLLHRSELYQLFRVILRQTSAKKYVLDIPFLLSYVFQKFVSKTLE